jgi:dihydropteroate synthase
MAEQMINEKADIIDVGGQSTRPESKRVSEEEEMQRVVPVIKLLVSHFPSTLFSIDTYYTNVAVAAVEAGVSMVNDISAGEMNKDMLQTVGLLGVPYVCMHMKGVPETMHLNSHYDNIVTEILDFFINKINECRSAGIKDVIIDPGFGFVKNIQHNFQLLKNIEALKMLGRPIMVGLSRKSSIYKTLGTDAENALNGTTVLNTIALLNGANILRVHDVKEAKEAVQLCESYTKA